MFISAEADYDFDVQAVNEKMLCKLVQQYIDQAEVHVRLLAGDDHFEIQVISPAFAGKSRVAQHQMVYEALGEHMRAGVHALALRTWTPEQWLKQGQGEQR